MKKCYDCPEWGNECSCGSSEHDSGDLKEVNKENGAQHYEAQEMESEPEMEVNETPENLTEDNIGKTLDEEKKVEPEFNSQVKKKSVNPLIVPIVIMTKLTRKKLRS